MAREEDQGGARAVLGTALVGPVGWLLATLLALPLPQDRVWGHALQAVLLAGRPWWLLVGALLVLLRVRRRPVLALLLGLLLALSAGRPDLSTAPPPPGALRVVSANINSYPSEPAPQAAAVLAALQPDVLLVIEQRAEDVPGLVRVADNYAVPMPRISHGHAVHCRPGQACAAAISPELGSVSSHMPLGLLRLPVPRPDGSTVDVCLLSLHAPPPAPIDPTGLLPYVERVAAAVSDGRLIRQWGPCLAGDAALLVGDFNTVPGTPAWSRLADGNGLTDVQRGRGLFRVSWPAGAGWPALPLFALDHVLVPDTLRVDAVRRHRVPGSDHLALSFWLSAR
ncbi:MAG: hypothetical protein H6742_01575 [Alphaproteobacteria bacterium]|nr:hypothetical protein [Alphaproteobacteria bacterium]